MTLRRNILAIQQQKKQVGADTIDLHEDYEGYYSEVINPTDKSNVKRILAEHTNASVIMDGMKKLRTAGFGVPEIISATNCPNATITAQCMEECTTISLDDNGSSCTQQGALGTGLELLKQFQEQVSQEPCGFCVMELNDTWQGDTIKTISGVRVKVTDEAGLIYLLSDEYDDVVTNGYINSSEVCFVGGDVVDGSPIRGTADGCITTGDSHGVLHARLWNHPDILLASIDV